MIGPSPGPTFESDAAEPEMALTGSSPSSTSAIAPTARVRKNIMKKAMTESSTSSETGAPWKRGVKTTFGACRRRTSPEIAPRSSW